MPKSLRGSGLRPKQSKIGRPRAWTSQLVREMLALHVFTDLTNEQILRSLRHSPKGVRSLQDLRKRLLGRDVSRARERCPRQTHQRIQRLCGLTRSICAPRSLAHRHPPDSDRSSSSNTERNSPKMLASSTEATRSTNDPTITGICFSISLVTTDATMSVDHAKFRLRLTVQGAPDIPSKSLTCNLIGITSSFDRMCRVLRTLVSPLLLECAPWSLVFKSVDLHRYPILPLVQCVVFLQERLARLVMNHCQLLSVPEAVRQFPKLKYLHLRRNKISELSMQMFPENLAILDLCHNRLTEVPEDFMRLVSLGTLDVSYNLIREVPSWLPEWINLQIILVAGNPLNTDHYYKFHQAFQHSCQQKSLSSCHRCLLNATNYLKASLSVTPGSLFSRLSLSLERSSSRAMSDAGSALTVTELSDQSTAENTRLRHHSCDVTTLRSFLGRMSLLSGGTQSSLSSITLQSMSTVSFPRYPSRHDHQALMLVHCCLLNDGHRRPSCLHRLIRDWINSGCETSLAYVKDICDMDGNTGLHVAVTFGAGPLALRSLILAGFSPDALNGRDESFLHSSSIDVWDPDNCGVLKFIRYLHDTGFNFMQRDIRGNTIYHRSETLWTCLKQLYPNIAAKCRSLVNVDGTQLEDDSTPSDTNGHRWFECDQHRITEHKEIRIFFKSIFNPAFDAISSTGLVKERNVPYPNACPPRCSHRCPDPLHELARLLSLGHTSFDVPHTWEKHASSTEGNSVDTGSMWSPCRVLQTIISSGADVNAYDQTGTTVLMAIIRAVGRQARKPSSSSTLEDCVALLIKNGANVRWLNRCGDTALHYAVHYGVPKVVGLLVEAGANVNARNDKGVSVMQLLLETIQLTKSNLRLHAVHLQCLKELVDYGAVDDPTVEQELGWLPDVPALEK